MTCGFLARLAAAALVSWGALFSSAGAAEWVRFAAAAGDLARPQGRGPFPALVVLHSCLGPRADRDALGATLTGWGYVALFVDDFATRGLTETCAVDFPQEAVDAGAAGDFLARQAEVDPARIAAIGFSQGGDTALAIAVGGAGAGRFRAAAAFYPPCANLTGRTLKLPTLVLVGADDQVTPAEDCRSLAEISAGRAIDDDARRLSEGRSWLRRSRLRRRQALARHAARLRPRRGPPSRRRIAPFSGGESLKAGRRRLTAARACETLRRAPGGAGDRSSFSRHELGLSVPSEARR